MLSRHLLPRTISGSRLSAVDVPPATQARVSTWRIVHIKFNQNPPRGAAIETCGKMDWRDRLHMPSFHSHYSGQWAGYQNQKSVAREELLQNMWLINPLYYIRHPSVLTTKFLKLTNCFKPLFFSRWHNRVKSTTVLGLCVELVPAPEFVILWRK
jgi:hypothetical protein